jgi:hypothetical protein
VGWHLDKPTAPNQNPPLCLANKGTGRMGVGNAETNYYSIYIYTTNAAVKIPYFIIKIF